MEKRKILIVDDERDTVFVTKVALSAKGYSVIFADNGPEGLRLVEKYRQALIILDILMPETDGVMVEKQLKSDPLTSEIPIIFSTCLGNCKVQDNKEDLIVKPYDIDDLIEKIEQMLARAEV